MESSLHTFTDWLKKYHLDSYYNTMISLVIKLVIAIVIFYIGKCVIHFILRIYKKLSKVHISTFDQSIFSFTYSLIKGALYIILCFVILNTLGFKLGSVFTLLGAVGISLSLALKDNLANLTSGIFLLVTRPFNIGHRVVINGHEGIVVEINIISTILQTPDGKEVIMNNRVIMSSDIENLSRHGERRIDLSIPIKIGVPFAEVKDFLINLIQEKDYILKTQNPRIIMRSVDLNQYEVEFSFWVTPSLYKEAQSRVLESIKDQSEFFYKAVNSTIQPK